MFENMPFIYSIVCLFFKGIGNAALNKSANNNKLTFKLRCNNVFKKGRTY